MIRVVFSLLMVVSICANAQKYDTIPRMPQLYKDRVALFQSEKVTSGKIMFVGNSITQGGKWKQLLGDSSVVNRGIGGDVTFGLLARIDEITRFKPSKLFLMIGINDLANNIPEDVVMENIFLIVNKIKMASPKTQIFVQSILPLNPTVPKFHQDYINRAEAIMTINGQLSKIAKRFGYTYVDLHSKFANAEGLMKPELSPDGLHLNAAGYKLWVKILKDAKHL